MIRSRHQHRLRTVGILRFAKNIKNGLGRLGIRRLCGSHENGYAKPQEDDGDSKCSAANKLDHVESSDHPSNDREVP